MLKIQIRSWVRLQKPAVRHAYEDESHKKSNGQACGQTLIDWGRMIRMLHKVSDCEAAANPDSKIP